MTTTTATTTYRGWTRRDLAVAIAVKQAQRGVIAHERVGKVAQGLYHGCGAVKPQTKAQLIEALEAVS